MATSTPPLRRQDDTIFGRVYCDELVIRPRTTPMKWDRSASAPGIIFLGSFDIARAATDGAADGAIGAIGTTEFIIGAAAAKWTYNAIAAAPDLRVGMAAPGFPPTSLAAAAAAAIDAAEGDIISFDLSMSAILLITHERRPGAVVSRFTRNLVEFVGTPLRPWAAIGTGSMSVRISTGADFRITVDADGKSRMTGTISDIVDFSLADIVANSSTPLPPAPPSDSIVNMISNASVTAENTGNIAHNGGISYKARLISAAGPVAALGADDFMAIIANATITTVQLPPIPASKAKKYIIARSYATQPGETIATPVLFVAPQLGDTIDGGSSIGLSANSRVTLISDGGADWQIL